MKPNLEEQKAQTDHKHNNEPEDPDLPFNVTLIDFHTI
jgi:hypothetical protein